MTNITQSQAAESEWCRNWPLVLAAMVGVSFITIPTATLGLFMAPLNAAFGWSRTEISAGLTIFALINLPLMPLAGMLVDKFGARRLALPGLVLCSLAFAAFALLNGSLVHWLASWVVFTLLSLTVGMVVWTTAVSSTFGKSRGLALALVLCGAAIAQALAPIVARWVIDNHGWRAGYVALAAGCAMFSP